MDNNSNTIADDAHLEPTKSGDPLIVPVSDYSYDRDTGKVSVHLSSAFQKSNAVEEFKGSEIIFSRDGLAITTSECPSMDITAENVDVDVSYVGNSADITVSDVTPKLDTEIRDAHCISLDANVVKGMMP